MISSANETYAVRACSPIKTHEGCISLFSATTCFCTTDGCNENFAKAGVEKAFVQTMAMSLVMVLSVLLVK